MKAVANELDGDAPALRPALVERREPARAARSFAGINGWIALATAFLLHAAVLGPVLFHFDFGPSAAPQEQEIPVEVVVEQPKPPPQPESPPQPEPQPSTAPRPPIDLEPAHDAPRSASDEKTPLDGADAKTNGEKAPAPDAPKTSPQPEPTAEPTQTAKAEPSAAPTPAGPKDDGGDDKAGDDPLAFAAPPVPPPDPADAQSKVATLIGQPLPTWSKGKTFSTYEPLPDVQFGASAASPVGGGKAATTYLTIVYGLVMKHLRLTDTMRSDAERAIGAIDFTVDGHGEVVNRSVVRPSGSNALDAAALEAVREAAPYPVPPMGLPIGLKFTYGAQ